jgi:Na+/proline symporter
MDTDLLYPAVALRHLGPTVGVVFILGLIAAAYSSADSALTALTTSFCVDILGFDTDEEAEEGIKEEQRRKRFFVHIGFSILLFFVILIFYFVNDQAVIKQIFTVATYTYGPLLGLYLFGFFIDRDVTDRLTPAICIASPIITFFINHYSAELFFGYKFGFELLIINGLITFIGLFIFSERRNQVEE